jgi:hypothetical protein
MQMGMFATILLCFGCSAASADTFNPNPNAVISILGSDRYVVRAPGATASPGLAIRVVDARGNPIQGLTVSFETEVGQCFPLDPRCVPPPQEIYGHFLAADPQVVLTDLNGIARSSPYIGGSVPGQYSVGAFISSSASAANAAVLQSGGDPLATFFVSQFGASIVPLPTTNDLAGVVLLLMIVGAALFNRRKAIEGR